MAAPKAQNWMQIGPLLSEPVSPNTPNKYRQLNTTPSSDTCHLHTCPKDTIRADPPIRTVSGMKPTEYIGNFAARQISWPWLRSSSPGATSVSALESASSTAPGARDAPSVTSFRLPASSGRSPYTASTVTAGPGEFLHEQKSGLWEVSVAFDTCLVPPSDPCNFILNFRRSCLLPLASVDA